jgi:YegS/Rv2252/BmrU family lipid kinase
MPHIICITNGNKKISVQNQRVLNELQQIFGSQFKVFNSKNPAEALAFIQTLKRNCTHLICVGGDGTFNVLINGICTHPDSSFQPIVGVLPNGTGNDFFRSAEFEKNPDFVKKIQELNFESIDVGCITTEQQTRYFANITDIGFGGAVVIELQNFRKRFGPNFSYGLAIIKTFLNYKRPLVQITAADFFYEGELLLAAFCNGSIFGDGLYIHPGAKINDGQLKLTLLGKVSLFDYVKNVIKVKRGKKIKHPEAYYLTVSSPLELHSLEGLLHAETDGEYLSGQTFKIELHASKIKLLPTNKT